jgi:exosortase/archaeosortase family protein
VFLTRFAIAFAFLYLLELAVVVVWPSVPRALAGGMATLVGGILSFAGVSHSVSGLTVALQSSSLSFNIGWGCLGGELFWSYIALVFAETTATRKQRLTGILVGLAILLAFNFFRITLSIYVEGQTGFNVHYLFYYINIFFVLLVWLGWLWTIRHRQSRFARSMA